MITLVAITFIVIKESNAECPTICTDDYKPLCARAMNGQVRIFSNRCELEVESCQVPSAGNSLKSVC